MRYLLSLFLLCCSSLLANPDYDCIVVGSSPFSLFEALYQHGLGRRVLILEEQSTCGGAWKSIDICGIANADLGCHQIGHDAELKQFLEEYVGCKMVSLDDPLLPFDPLNNSNGYYFSRGCFELVDHALQLIEKTSIAIKVNHRVETLSVDPTSSFAIVGTPQGEFTTSKVILTPMSCLSKENSKSKYYHLYLLIQDPSPPRFCYKNGNAPGVSRMVNLSHFTDTVPTGRQLIVFQTHGESYLGNGQQFIDDLKEKGLIDPSAYILKQESLIYEAGRFESSLVQRLNAPHLFETLSTGHIQGLSSYVTKWKQVLRPWE